MSEPKLQYIDTADIARLFMGKRSGSWCRKVARTIRDAHGIAKGIPIPVEYFCEYSGFSIEHVDRVLRL